MALTPGTRLGPYEILSPIGAGGMGEVYKARDTRLDRYVAIKILSEAFASDADRVARFQREAKTLAALNHPNIAQIFGLEQTGNEHALAMEFVAGEDLSDRIVRGPIPINEALPIAKQIAEALEAAHEQGIIHRDLKPGNIKVRSDGTVKVLDFGLAKALEPLTSSPDMSQSPTITTPAMTQAGMILGTAAYMSPEQARGQAVDKRTDVWAFGCVVFEMLSGAPTFRKHTLPDTIAAVLEREPNWVALSERTPPGIRRLLQRCLQKDAKWRLRDIGDARIEIAAALGPENVESARERDASWYRRYGVGFVALAGTLAMMTTALGWAWVSHSGSALELKTLRLQVSPPEGTQFVPDSGSAIAPDGSLIAFVAQRSGETTLWVRPVNGITARELPGTQGANFPFWSPDSRSLGFFASGKLKRIDVSGAGLPGAICDVQLGRGGSWNADGTILFNYTNDGPLMRVTASGGSPTAQTTVDTAKLENSHRWPQFLPDGRRFLYLVRASNPAVAGIYVGSLDRQEEKTLVVNTQSSGIYAEFVPEDA